MIRLLLLLAAGLTIAGCATTETSQAQLVRRASFDLDCPAGALTVVDLDDRTRGVKGCNQRATYIEQCKPCANGYQGCECTWVLNADTRLERPKDGGVPTTRR